MRQKTNSQPLLAIAILKQHNPISIRNLLLTIIQTTGSTGWQELATQIWQVLWGINQPPQPILLVVCSCLSSPILSTIFITRSGSPHFPAGSFFSIFWMGIALYHRNPDQTNSRTDPQKHVYFCYCQWTSFNQNHWLSATLGIIQNYQWSTTANHSWNLKKGMLLIGLQCTRHHEKQWHGNNWQPTRCVPGLFWLLPLVWLIISITSLSCCLLLLAIPLSFVRYSLIPILVVPLVPIIIGWQLWPIITLR